MMKDQESQSHEVSTDCRCSLQDHDCAYLYIEFQESARYDSEIRESRDVLQVSAHIYSFSCLARCQNFVKAESHLTFASPRAQNIYLGHPQGIKSESRGVSGILSA